MSGELLVELGVEELPARMVGPAVQGFADGVRGLLEGIAHGEVRTFSTPRRLAVAVAGVADAAPTVEVEVTGPPADKAFDADGRPTKVGEGFARGKGVPVEALRVVELPKRGAVVAVTVTEGGETTLDRLQRGLADVIARIPFPKTMVWADGDGLAFGRPLQRITVVFGGEPVVGAAHGLPFGATVAGHRLVEGELRVSDVLSYINGLRERLVEPDREARKATIRAQLAAAAAAEGADPVDDEALLEEVTDLVEVPHTLVGRFDDELLALPPRLLVTSMKVNQRYFPLFRNGALTSAFLVVTNNPRCDAGLVAEGNARVLRARFYDARFFLAEDRRQTLAQHGEKLRGMRWIRGLGTMADKVRRLTALAPQLAEMVGADPEAARAAAGLCKADLATQMVGEFPDLQGHVGHLAALAEGLPAEVSSAIEEAYLPRFSGDATAASPAGRALALADRVDTLVGCFGVGLEPKGGDPQGLRRAAVGVIATLRAVGQPVSLRRLFERGAQVFGEDALGEDVGSFDAPRGVRFDLWREHARKRTGADLVAALLDFTRARYKALAVAEGHSADVVDAVLEAEQDDVIALDARLGAIARLAGTPAFPALLQTVKRVLNIARDAGEVEVVREGVEPAERALATALTAAEEHVGERLRALDVEGALQGALSLQEPVEAFFDAVMVLADDEAVRARRLGLLAGVAGVFRRLADFSRITTR